MKSSCAPTTTRPTSPSRAESKTGSSSRTRSGTRGRAGSGRPSGSSESRSPGSQYLRWTPNLERWEIAVEAHIAGAPPGKRLHLAVRLRCNEVLLADDRYLVVAGEVHRRIALSDPGIDDFRNELLWSPSSPKLIDAEVRLVDEDGVVLDTVTSYTALRSFVVQGDRLVLNGRPYGCGWCSIKAIGRTRA